MPQQPHWNAGRKGLTKRKRVLQRSHGYFVADLSQFMAADSETDDESDSSIPPLQHDSRTNDYKVEGAYLLSRLVRYRGKDAKYTTGRERIRRQEGR